MFDPVPYDNDRPLEVVLRTLDGVAIIYVHGSFKGTPATLFHDVVHKLVEARQKKLVVDLTEVDTIDTLGLGYLAAALTTVSNQEGIFVLVGLTNKVRAILERGKLLNVFVAFETTERALTEIREWTFLDFLRVRRTFVHLVLNKAGHSSLSKSKNCPPIFP